MARDKMHPDVFSTLGLCVFQRQQEGWEQVVICEVCRSIIVSDLFLNFVVVKIIKHQAKHKVKPTYSLHLT